MPTNSLIERTIDVAAEIDRITKLHEEYASGSRVPALPDKELIHSGLVEILDQESLIYDSPVVEAASVVMGALQDDTGPQTLPHLGKALVLAVESKRGRTDEVGFQDTVRYLLAQNGYNPVRTSKNFHFFSDDSGEKVVALAEKGVDLYTIHLKSKYGLDDLVKDFRNLKKGTNQNLEQWKKGKGGFLFTIAGLFATFIPAFTLLPYQFTSPEGLGPIINGYEFMTITLGTGALTTYTGNKIDKFLLRKRYQRLKNKEIPTFPYKTVTSGVYALVDAFCVSKNPVLSVVE